MTIKKDVRLLYEYFNIIYLLTFLITFQFDFEKAFIVYTTSTFGI